MSYTITPPITERFRAYRERMKQAGYKRLTFEVPHEFKVMFDRLCEKQNVTAREMFCILVAHYEDEEEARAQPETTNESEIEHMGTKSRENGRIVKSVLRAFKLYKDTIGGRVLDIASKSKWTVATKEYLDNS